MKPLGQNNRSRSPIIHDFHLYGLSPDQRKQRIEEFLRARSKQRKQPPHQFLNPPVSSLERLDDSPKSQKTGTNLGKENISERRFPDFDGSIDSGVGAGSSCCPDDAGEIEIDRKTTAESKYCRKAKRVVFKRTKPRKRNARNSVFKSQRKIPPATQTVDPQNVRELQDGQTNGKRKFSSEAEIASIRAKKRKWLETRQTDSQWVKCCHENCGKWRLAFQYEDAAEVPEFWYCDMNLDDDFSSCDAPEEKIPKTVRLEMIETQYSIGSLVWARLDGYPWWPGMVDEGPDSFTFCMLEGTSTIPTKYNVVFFDSKKANRAWVRKRDLKPYKKNPRELVVKKTKFRNRDWKPEIDDACALADTATPLTVSQRIKKFGWVALNSKKPVKTTEATRRSQRLRDKYLLKDNGLTREEEIEREKLETRFKVGDIVWAQAYKCPWWPAMIDTCPKLNKHVFVSKTRQELSKYFVVYFGDGLIYYDYLSEAKVEEFSRMKLNGKTKYRNNQEKKKLQQAYKLAMEAKQMPLNTRLQRFGIKQRSDEQCPALANEAEWTTPKGSPAWYDDERETDKLRDEPISFPNYSRSPLSEGESFGGSRTRTKKSAGSTSSAKSPSISPHFSPQPGCSGINRFPDLKTLSEEDDASVSSSISNDAKYFPPSRTNSEFSSPRFNDLIKKGQKLVEEIEATVKKGF